ncbi:Pentatricopeptide repeat-containing protein [Stylosanthes scabra]|uniref:Pentatricopeptide repeat-containing protein n=1 Tax=Stylosanthes scabra TaxID=79078 RepID=A0ABU6RHP6_9FABA|nr:Pentatricopeptide repeat-containing protein [Stylosanthes scabra]
MRNGQCDSALRIFNSMPHRTSVSYNTMISGYLRNGHFHLATDLFDKMPQRDLFSWNVMLTGSNWDLISWNCLMAGYLKRNMLGGARRLFDQMPVRDNISWNTMITGYAQDGDMLEARRLFDECPADHYEEALKMFVAMKRDGESLNRGTFSCALSSCADIAALELGKQVHGQAVKTGYETGCFVGNALLAMYFKCGSIDEAYAMFEAIEEKDIVSWNTMLAGYARHGFGKQALSVFESMNKAGVKPDEITMVGVLSACSHTGLIDKGTEYFYSMTEVYGIAPNLKHYACMIDLLGRAGRLEEAENLMRSMPFEPSAAAWGTLLGACRIHGNTELAEKAAEMVFKMEPHNTGMYVLLSNLYATSGRWADVGKMRSKLRDVCVQKVPGYSWVEVQNKIHKFTVGDRIHPEKDRIYAFLEELDQKMKLEGYVSSTKLVLHDVEEEEKEHMLKYHSEKLAVAFGILTIPADRPIRVMKNLRVCQDCHNAIKHISKIVGRLIILRDSHRFHHFSNGICSCGDYW